MTGVSRSCIPYLWLIALRNPKARRSLLQSGTNSQLRNRWSISPSNLIAAQALSLDDSAFRSLVSRMETTANQTGFIWHSSSSAPCCFKSKALSILWKHLFCPFDSGLALGKKAKGERNIARLISAAYENSSPLQSLRDWIGIS